MITDYIFQFLSDLLKHNMYIGLFFMPNNFEIEHFFFNLSYSRCLVQTVLVKNCPFCVCGHDFDRFLCSDFFGN